MKHPVLSGLILSCCIIPFACSIAGAQPNNPCGQPWNTPLETVEGEIIDGYYSSIPGTQKEGLHLKVETSSGEEVLVHVFPKKCIKNNPEAFVFYTTDMVAVAGSEFFTGPGGGQRNICAAELWDQEHNFTGEDNLRDIGTGYLNTELCRPADMPSGMIDAPDISKAIDADSGYGATKRTGQPDCTAICQNNCSGKPSVCIRICMNMCSSKVQ